MTEVNKDKAAARINQLRAIAKSTHSKAEAETCLEIAARMMAEFQLQDADLEVKSGGKDVGDEIFTDRESMFNVVYESGRTTLWKYQLVQGLAELNGLYLISFQGIRGETTHRRGNRYRVFGRKSDIEICKYMFGAMTAIVQSLAEVYIPGGVKRGVNPERESWATGCVAGFLDKMRRQHQKVLEASHNSQAMVLVANRVDAAEEAFAKAYPKMQLVSRKKISKAQLHINAYSSGYTRGQQIGLPNKALK